MDRKERMFSSWGRGGMIAVVCFTLWTMACAVTGEVKEEIRTIGDLELSHTNVVEHIGEGGPDIVVEVVGGSTEGVLKEDGLRLLFRERGMEQFATTYMGKAGTPSLFQASIPHHEKAAWVDYKIEVHGAGGELLIFPGGVGEQGEEVYYSVRFKGAVPKFWLVLHVVTMFLGLLLFLVAAYLSWKYIKARGGYEGVEKISLWGLASLFIGGFPLGFLMGWYTFGKPWTGFPIGGDVTDTKTLIVFVYWLIAIFFRAGSSEDEAKQRRYAWLVIWGAALAAFIYLIPHSI